MALILFCLCAALSALVIAAGASLLSRGPRPIAAAVIPAAALIEAPGRTYVRPALQTSAALLALAIALDVSAAPQSLMAAAGPDGVYSAAAAKPPFVLGDTAAQVWAPVEPAADWAFKAVNTTDGWLI
jgi:hypothetical protein